MFRRLAEALKGRPFWQVVTLGLVGGVVITVGVVVTGAAVLAARLAASPRIRGLLGGRRRVAIDAEATVRRAEATVEAAEAEAPADGRPGVGPLD